MKLRCRLKISDFAKLVELSDYFTIAMLDFESMPEGQLSEIFNHLVRLLTKILRRIFDDEAVNFVYTVGNVCHILLGSCFR